MKHALQIAIEAALLAGAAIREEYEKPHEIEIKEDDSPVTQADRRANAIIVDYLSRHYPDYAILAEESADDPARLENDWCWVVDPLDGTREYIKRNGEFTVNIALTYQHQVRLGVVYVPITHELYYASAGEGAFYRRDGADTRIHVSDRTEELVVLMSRSHLQKRNKELIERNRHRIRRVIAAGSSLKGCLVAQGQADVYYRFGPTMEWDVAAMECIVNEAGGLIREMDGSVFRYNRENPLNEKGFYILNTIANRME